MPFRVAPKFESSASSDVLLALLGMSPAVLTETVWALAHENPPILPDRIGVITTRPGRDKIKKILFDDRPDGLSAS